jgi:hypothetical protein
MPKKKAPMDKVYQLRADAAQVARWSRAAARDRRSLADWMRVTLDIQAEK